MLFSNNLVNSSFSELYHANGSSNGYDQLNQLSAFARGVLSDTNSDNIPDTISSPAHSQSWSFDALGNWSSVITDGNTQTRTANQQNEIISISGQTTPGYDANGNTTTDQTGHTLIFDAWNRFVQDKNGQTVIETYSYDALGRRVTENAGTVRDIFFTTSWQVIEEDVASSMADQYVWSPVYIDALIERDTPTLRMYALQTANFNVTSLVDTSGAVQERYDYDPFGSVIILAPNWTTRSSSNYGWVFFFQGKRFDSATGLYWSRERDESPTLGRFIENDPIGYMGNSSNLYSYVNNSPIRLSDPSGLCAVTPEEVDPWQLICPPAVHRPPDKPYWLWSLLGFAGGGGTVALAPTPVVVGSSVVTWGIPVIAVLGGGLGVAIGVSPGLTNWLGGLLAAAEGMKPVPPLPPISDPKPPEDKNCKKCKPCIPPVGTISYRLDQVPPSTPHFPFPGDHVHLFEMHQSPVPMCICFWHPTSVQAPPPPPGAIPIVPAGGGGVA